MKQRGTVTQLQKRAFFNGTDMQNATDSCKVKKLSITLNVMQYEKSRLKRIEIYQECTIDEVSESLTGTNF